MKSGCAVHHEQELLGYDNERGNPPTRRTRRRQRQSNDHFRRSRRSGNHRDMGSFLGVGAGMNQQDSNDLTTFWHRGTNRINDIIDDAFKSAQDDAYARGYRRGREDLIEIRKQRDELLDLLDEATSYTSCPAWSPSLTEEINKAIASAKGQT
jgi:hypothetical protein